MSIKSEVNVAIVLRDIFLLARFEKSRSDGKSSASFVKFSTDDAGTKYVAKNSFRNSSRGTIPASL